MYQNGKRQCKGKARLLLCKPMAAVRGGSQFGDSAHLVEYLQVCRTKHHDHRIDHRIARRHLIGWRIVVIIPAFIAIARQHEYRYPVDQNQKLPYRQDTVL